MAGVEPNAFPPPDLARDSHFHHSLIFDFYLLKNALTELNLGGGGRLAPNLMHRNPLPDASPPPDLVRDSHFDHSLIFHFDLFKNALTELN